MVKSIINGQWLINYEVVMGGKVIKLLSAFNGLQEAGWRKTSAATGNWIGRQD